MNRRMMMTVKTGGYAPRLPSAYQEVEYIANSSTAFINTGYTLTSNNARFKGAFYKAAKPSSEEFVTGSYGGGKTATELGLSSTSGRIFAYSTSSAGINDYANLYGNKVYFDAVFQTASPAKTLTISTDGSSETTATATGANTTITGSVILMFAGHPTQSQLKFTGRLYFLEVYDNNVLVHSFVPCYRKSDNKVGMYDMITNEFHTSYTSSSFEKGADVN